MKTVGMIEILIVTLKSVSLISLLFIVLDFPNLHFKLTFSLQCVLFHVTKSNLTGVKSLCTIGFLQSSAFQKYQNVSSSLQ